MVILKFPLEGFSPKMFTKRYLPLHPRLISDYSCEKKIYAMHLDHQATLFFFIVELVSLIK